MARTVSIPETTNTMEDVVKQEEQLEETQAEVMGEEKLPTEETPAE